MTQRVTSNPFTFTTTEVRRNLTAIMRKIREKRKPAIIISGGELVAVLLSEADYERLLRYQRVAEFNKLAKTIGRDIEKSGLTEKQLMEDLEETKREVFRERYGRI